MIDRGARSLGWSRLFCCFCAPSKLGCAPGRNKIGDETAASSLRTGFVRQSTADDLLYDTIMDVDAGTKLHGLNAVCYLSERKLTSKSPRVAQKNWFVGRARNRVRMLDSKDK